VLSKKLIQKHGLFAYSTHSHVSGEECQRFRLAIGLDTTITDKEHYEGVIRHLVQNLGSDTACTDACRLYYGNPGAEITWLNEDAEPLEVAALAVTIRASANGIRGSLHWSQVDREKALACLEFIPPRGPKGSGTYPDSIRALFALLNTFGEEEAKALVGEAEWHGDWDLDEVIEGALNNPAHDRSCGMGTLIQIAREHGLPANVAKCREPQAKSELLVNAVREVALMKLNPGAHTWAEIDIKLSEISSRFGLSSQRLHLRIEQTCGELLGIDLGGREEAGSYNIDDEWAEVDSEDNQTSFLVPGLIREKGVAMLVSPGGVGKTEMACAISKCIADGEGFLHHADIPSTGGKRTLFIEADMENGARRCIIDYYINAGVKPEEAKTWLTKWVKLWCADPEKGRRSWRFNKPAIMELKEELETGNYSLVIIDSLKKIVAGTDFDYTKNTDMHLLMTLLTGLITPHAALLILHHTNKSENDGMKAIGGASSIGEMVDAVHQLSRKDFEGGESIYTFETTKARNGIGSCRFRYERTEEGEYVVIYPSLGDEEKDLATRIYDVLDLEAQKEGYTGILRTSEIARRVRAKEKTVSNKLTAISTTTPKYVRRRGNGWEITQAGRERVKQLREEDANAFKKMIGRGTDF